VKPGGDNCGHRPQPGFAGVDPFITAGPRRRNVPIAPARCERGARTEPVADGIGRPFRADFEYLRS